MSRTLFDRKRERNADYVARNVLCRVFLDGADKAMDEWLDWYDPREWFHFSRALGAFIWRRQHPKQARKTKHRKAGAVSR